MGTKKNEKKKHKFIKKQKIYTPAIVYFNMGTDKLGILKDNKSKAGVYQWPHKGIG